MVHKKRGKELKTEAAVEKKGKEMFFEGVWD